MTFLVWLLALNWAKNDFSDLSTFLFFYRFHYSKGLDFFCKDLLVRKQCDPSLNTCDYQPLTPTNPAKMLANFFCSHSNADSVKKRQKDVFSRENRLKTNFWTVLWSSFSCSSIFIWLWAHFKGKKSSTEFSPRFSRLFTARPTSESYNDAPESASTEGSIVEYLP